jgi:hypothetical protein
MTKNISSFENVVQEIDRMSLDEQLELIAYIAGKIQQYKSTTDQKHSLKSIIGTEKDCFATPEAADKFISQERDRQQEKALERLNAIREEIQQTHGIYFGDLIAEVRGEREEQIERLIAGEL